MHYPPESMQALMQGFADNVRKKPMLSNKDSANYHEFVWGNVHSVVTQTFPLFSENLTEETLQQWVTAFIKESHAIEPEFHHIATEFVRFVQSNNQTLSSQLTSLLEYEWVVFSTEINTNSVPLTTMTLPETLSAQWLSDCVIEVNPTLQLIEVPFQVKGSKVQFNEVEETPQAYAVYRNSVHQVLSQPLKMNDRLILIPLSQYRSVTFESLLSEFNENLSINHIIHWVQHFNQTELIKINKVKS